MGTEYLAVALGALSSAIGGLCLFVLSGLRADIAALRLKVDAHGEAIAQIKGGLERT